MEDSMDKSASKKPTNATQGANEGEGSRTAARDYNQRTERFIQSGKVDESAKKAERAIEGDERRTLSEAEKAGRSHAKH
jgi:hypothetical protein